MTYWLPITLIINLLAVSYVSCIGQFFEITKDNLPLKKDQLFLSNDDFECGKKDSCKTIARKATSQGSNDDDGEVVFAMKKVNG